MKNKISIVFIICITLMFVCVNSATSATKSKKSVSDSSTVAESVIEGKININVADEEKLTNLPGVGPKMAERISEYRKANGPFKSVDDLINIKGIGPKIFEKIKPFVKVS